MPVYWNVRDRVGYLVSEGATSFGEWKAVVDGFLDDEEQLGALLGVLHDWTNLGELPSTRDLENRGRYLTEKVNKVSRLRWALLVARPAQYGMARLQQSNAPGVDIRIFRDRGEAESWLREKGKQ